MKKIRKKLKISLVLIIVLLLVLVMSSMTLVEYVQSGSFQGTRDDWRMVSLFTLLLIGFLVTNIAYNVGNFERAEFYRRVRLLKGGALAKEEIPEIIKYAINNTGFFDGYAYNSHGAGKEGRVELFLNFFGVKELLREHVKEARTRINTPMGLQEFVKGIEYDKYQDYYHQVLGQSLSEFLDGRTALAQ